MPGSRRSGALAVATALAASSLLTACLGFGGVPPPSYARYNEYLPCSTRIGRCFDLIVAGQTVEVIEEEERQKALGSMASQASYEIRDLYWQIPQPIDGGKALSLEVKPAGDGDKILGGQRGDPALTVWALSEVERPEPASGESAYSARRKVDVVATKLDLGGRTRLEPGRYVYEVRYLGQLDWDRKFVYLTVR
ncbi:MAG: hypothetical protein KDH20_20010 [Rhodocyclaceae bacterium]|nr:hypothetical protein [Rhodocyclaceae bacterium]